MSFTEYINSRAQIKSPFKKFVLESEESRRGLFASPGSEES